MTDKFMFFENFKNTADKLPDDLRLKFYDALTDYVFAGTEPDDPIVGALITALKPSLDREETRGGFRAGSGRPKSNENQNEIKNNQKNQNADLIFSEKSNEIKNNQNDVLKKNENQKNQSFQNKETETERKKDISSLRSDISKESAKRFSKPSVEEIRSYCQERNNGIDAEKFFDFYEAKGWVVGKSPMKDWKASVRTWETNRGGSGGSAIPKHEEPTKPDNSKYYDETGKFDWRAKCRDMGVDV